MYRCGRGGPARECRWDFARRQSVPVSYAAPVARQPLPVRLSSRRRVTLVGLARRLPSDHSPWPP